MESGFGILPLVLIAIYLFVIVFPIWRILSRMGFTGWLSLLALIPLVNLILLWVLSFVRWPIEREVGRVFE